MAFDLAEHTDLAGQNRCRYKSKRYRAHLFSETRQSAGCDGQCGFWRYVATRRAGTSGRQNQIAVVLITQFLERCFDERLLVGDEFFDDFIIGKQGLCQPFLQRGNTFVLISSGRGTVGNGNQADFCFAILHRLPPL